MVRALIFFIKLAVLVAVAVWIADQPGQVLIEWHGYRIETTVGILLLVVLAVAGLAAVLYRFWGAAVRLPRGLGRRFRLRRRRRGYEALTQGMVSVAAGDPDEARRFARKADSLLEEPPLTMLLSAQAAQLNGDDQAAKRYFSAMLESPETRFLGLRGLLRQAEREGDWAAALDYARQAYDLRPRTPWVLSSLFDLSLRAGDLERALEAVGEMRKRDLLSREEADRRRGVLLTEQARAAHADGRDAIARDASRQAIRLVPGLPAAARVRAQVLLDDGRKRAAAKIVEEAWARQPHPDLVDVYLEARPAKDALGRLNRLSKLAEHNHDHRESALAQGRAALEAELWGEARRYLQKAGGALPTEGICRLMAEIEEREKDDGEAARQWLLRAADSPGDPAWICGVCGAVAAEWHATCGHCGSFDSFSWRTPPRVVEAAPLSGPAQHARLEAATARTPVVEEAEATDVQTTPADGEIRPEADAAQAERQPS